MPRKDICRNSPVSRYGGIPGEDASALGVTRQAGQIKEDQKIKCSAQLPDYNFRGCGTPLNSSNARKVRSKKRLPICGPCRKKLCEEFHNKRHELNQLIDMKKSPRGKPPGSGREPKKKTERIEKANL